MGQRRRLSSARPQARAEPASQPNEDAVLVVPRCCRQDVDGGRERSNGLLHLLLRALKVLVLLGPQARGELHIGVQLLEVLLQICALGGELNAAVVEVRNVGVQGVYAAGRVSVRGLLGADDALRPADKLRKQLLLCLALRDDLLLQRLQQPHDTGHRAQALHRKGRVGRVCEEESCQGQCEDQPYDRHGSSFNGCTRRTSKARDH
mmetsp:Transcript_545/g.1889  ORF Transcript_545/g.1889 Transcript_545/m.1889 type:complete len:206 (+) Transcript_545:1772-2389(+)